MPAPFRIEVKKGETKLDEYLGKLIKLIPGAAVGIYLTGKGFVPAGAIGWWALAGLVLVLLFRAFGTQDRKRDKPTQWVGVTIATISYLIWVYAIGDHIATFQLASSARWIPSVAVLVWTGITPLFYKGENT